MSHDDQMRSLRLMGQEVIPAVREMAKELDLKSPFEVDTKTGEPIEDSEAAPVNADYLLEIFTKRTGGSLSRPFFLLNAFKINLLLPSARLCLMT